MLCERPTDLIQYSEINVKNYGNRLHTFTRREQKNTSHRMSDAQFKVTRKNVISQF